VQAVARPKQKVVLTLSSTDTADNIEWRREGWLENDIKVSLTCFHTDLALIPNM
jgi:hypothetical protein